MAILVTKSVNNSQEAIDRSGHENLMGERYVTGMVTRARKGIRPPIYLREWMDEKGVDAEIMAGRLGIERESVYRLIREPRRIDLDRLGELAQALRIKPIELFYPPQHRSVDAMLLEAPESLRETVRDIAQRLVDREP